MGFLKFYMEDKKEDIKKKWKILQFLEDEDYESSSSDFMKDDNDK